ncbi:Smr/MutS family protein [Geoalkalibacter sp.]|uniref:Smr/MutS family protein n=1 Tax=Geoalkalibacter sp. TaxID=3041440 RepID=UPI00272E055F|nr:Smr/MutS family protein [Geoalkalibacter sp.]
MARKKRPQPSAEVKQPQFAHNPFRDLKGLSVSAPPGKTPKVKEAKPVPLPAAEKDELLFLEEMAFLRVSPTKHRAAGEGEDPLAEPEWEEDSEGSPPPPVPLPEDDQTLFLRALGEMQCTFRDELPVEPPEPQASPRRMRELERGRFKPEAELDLHGLDRMRARERVRHFLDNCRHQGLRTVLVITGVGHHSNEEPVLRGEVERFLNEEGRSWVIEWGRAPRRYGGAGALVVFLKK